MGKFDNVLLVSDYDETLRAEENDYVSRENLDAVEYFCRNGGRFTLCTGRDLCSYLRIRHLFTVNAPVILSNGAVIYDDKTEEIIYETYLPDRARDDIKKYMDMFPSCGFEIHKGKNAYVIRENAGTRSHMESVDINAERKKATEVPMPWNKFSIYTDSHPKADEKLIGEILAAVNEEYDGYRSLGMVDVARKGVTKGSGAMQLCKILGINRNDLYCVGDGWNDIPMLKAARIGFAPKTANRDVLKENVRIVNAPEDHAIQDVVNILDSLY